MTKLFGCSHRQPSAQAGFVLLMVLVVILLISGATVLLLNQNTVDARSAIYHHEQQSLYAAADTALTSSWQQSEHELSSMITDRPDGWLTMLINSQPESQYPMVKSCDGWRSFGVGVSDGHHDLPKTDCPAQSLGYVWQVAYALPVGEDHYLHHLTKANDAMHAKAADESPKVLAQHRHVLMYGIAVQHRAAAEPCLDESLLHAHITSCLIDQGVRYKLVAAEWLVSVYQHDPAEVDSITASVIKLRTYDLRNVRE